MFGLAFGIKGMAIASVIAYLAGGVGGAYITAKIYGNRNARAEIKVLRTDLKVAKEVAENSSLRANEIAASDAVNQEKIRDLNLLLAKRPAADRCELSAPDARWLRGLK